MLHTADVHLECDSYGKPDHRQAQQVLYERCFEAMVTRALSAQVDIFLIAGDLFDHNRASDDSIAVAQEQLRRLACPTVILPGNHDCLTTNAIYDRHNFQAACPNVQVITALDGQVLEFPELDLVVWGRGMEEHTPEFRPLAHIPSRHDQRWHVAMAHGFFFPRRQTPDRSSPIFADEIRDTGWDYVALGHQHVLMDLSQGPVTAYYPGAPLVNWTGETQGHLLLVELSPEHGVQVRPERVL